MTSELNLSFLSPSSMAVISIASILLCGFLATRITRIFKLPDVTAYIVTGILMGPYVLNIIPKDFIESTSFLSDIALSFIAFSTGEFFKIETLRKNGFKIITLSIIESLIVAIIIFILSRFILGLSIPLSLVLSALAMAVAPASIMMTIRTTRAKGEFVETLLQVIAIDDVLALLTYSIAIAIFQATLNPTSFNMMNIIRPLITSIIAIILGGVFGIILQLFIQDKYSSDNRLIIAIALLFGYCGICTIFDVSPLLGCMAMAMMYINITDDDRLFKQLNYFSPPILLLFFVRSGLNFNIGALFNNSNSITSHPLILISILYFIIRIIGKYFGTYISCKLTNRSEMITKYLGFALFPQAGVAIGLAALGARVIGGAQGDALNTIIVSSSILYEFVGPICAKYALEKSGSFSKNLEEITDINTIDEQGKEKGATELLIERINKIQQQLPKHEINEYEKAFDEAIDEQDFYPYRKRR